MTLKQDDEQAIELFDWSGVAVARADSFEQQISSLNDRCRVAEDTIRKLSAQFEELVLAKTQHEIQLTASFVQLLNEKKLKIRNQQRLLVSATVDPAKGIYYLRVPPAPAHFPHTHIYICICMCIFSNLSFAQFSFRYADSCI